MSNQFSYELDERQIRLMMLNSESDYNEVAWQRFESTLSNNYKPVVKASLPRINISISRSFIIPVLFIGLIGSLSILLFSFVDLKKKEEVVVEKPLQISKPVTKPKVVTKKLIAQPKINTPPITETVPKEKTLTSNIASTVDNSTSSITTESKVVLEPSAKDFKPTETANKESATVVQNNNTPVNSIKNTESKPKRKKKHVVFEELPTITAPVNLTTSGEEPELDLK